MFIPSPSNEVPVHFQISSAPSRAASIERKMDDPRWLNCDVYVHEDHNRARRDVVARHRRAVSAGTRLVGPRLPPPSVGQTVAPRRPPPEKLCEHNRRPSRCTELPCEGTRRDTSLEFLIAIESTQLCNCRGQGLRKSCFKCNFTVALLNGTNTQLFFIICHSFLIHHFFIR